MIIFPAIDIKNGKCVRLVRGDFENMTSYKNSPLISSQKSGRISVMKNHNHIPFFKRIISKVRVNIFIIEK